jgi:2-polyprenyl-3-methyl-5-hydroxy-6-metoxy-1,4-benzoquinol methylase
VSGQNTPAKVRYLLRCGLDRLFGLRLECPNCGFKKGEIVDRKWVVTLLKRCAKCQLLHRVPRSSKVEQKDFYQKKYSQGFTTEMPKEGDLHQLKDTKFQGTPRDYSSYITTLRSLGLKKGASVLEYGCSWGYGAWQIREAGFYVTGFEISEPRCRYAREKLGIHSFHKAKNIKRKFDAVFSSHVLEHVDSLDSCLDEQMKFVKKGGLLIGITPNGSAKFRSASPQSFHNLWGFVHPQLIDETFLVKKFQGHPIFISSLPISRKVALKDRGQPHLGDLKGWELIFAIRKG